MDRVARFSVAVAFLSLGSLGVYGISYHLDREYGIGALGLLGSVGIFLAAFSIVGAIACLVLLLGKKH
jgi:hypothetical protein